MKKAILVAIIGAMTLGVNAGDWGKAPVIDKVPIEECYDIGGEISAGYMTDYIFNGVRFARDSAWVDVNYTIDSLWAPINVGVWYLNGINPTGPAAGNVLGGNNLDELDLYASVGLGSFAGIDATLGYTHYFFPESNIGSYGEVGLDLAYSLGWVDLTWSTDLASTKRGGLGSSASWFHTFGLEREFGITDSVSLVLAAAVGYSDGYFGPGFYGLTPNAATPRDSGWNHYSVTASLPIELNCRATLTPYIGYNGAPDSWVADGIQGIGGQPQSDILHGGVSLSVSF
tara:strand:- start:1519 stop:2376 length:858 start_codon:yes stop_codon:yes gene_type:complete